MCSVPCHAGAGGPRSGPNGPIAGKPAGRCAMTPPLRRTRSGCAGIERLRDPGGDPAEPAGLNRDAERGHIQVKIVVAV